MKPHQTHSHRRPNQTWQDLETSSLLTGAVEEVQDLWKRGKEGQGGGGGEEDSQWDRSQNKNLDGRQLGLSPIHRMNGPGGNFVSTMVYSHRPITTVQSARCCILCDGLCSYNDQCWCHFCKVFDLWFFAIVAWCSDGLKASWEQHHSGKSWRKKRPPHIRIWTCDTNAHFRVQEIPCYQNSFKLMLAVPETCHNAPLRHQGSTHPTLPGHPIETLSGLAPTPALPHCRRKERQKEHRRAGRERTRTHHCPPTLQAPGWPPPGPACPGRREDRTHRRWLPELPGWQWHCHLHQSPPWFADSTGQHPPGCRQKCACSCPERWSDHHWPRRTSPGARKEN